MYILIMIDKKLGYSKDTEKLIDKMCLLVEREDFELEKEKAVECLMKTYDLFKLKRPYRVVWCSDIFDNFFIWSAGNTWSAPSARSSGSAWIAGRARSDGSAGRAWNAGRARSADSAGRDWGDRSAGRTRSSGSAWIAGSALSARSALDYDFDWFVLEYEYIKNPDKEYPFNDNDKKYVEYSKLLMKAMEYGLGYRVEWKDTLCLV